ncbi:MAG: glycosyltransferase family 2 protein [Planctomycetota bacterium]|nr:glycosyltransferase family 2 protein [Planctomycetota bacterium]
MNARTDASDATGGLGPVSVVVCNYNGEHYLAECLESVAQLGSGVGEVIVVDNASTDRSREIAAECGARVVALAVNDGPCPARNAGMKAAKNRWVLALDNDAVCTREMLTRLCAAAAEAERSSPGSVAIVQPRSVFASETSRVHYDGGAFHYVGLIALRNFYAPLAQANGHGTLAVDCAVAVALLVDREAVLEIGGYDETMFILFEDLDLSFRLRACGKRILSVEDALVLHKGGTPGISFRDGPRYPGSRVFFHSRNRWTFLAKCAHWRTLVVALPGLFVYECVWFAFALAAFAPHQWLRGKWRFVLLFGHIRRERARFQARRTVADKDLFVGGPLTITPALKSSGPKAFVLATLDAALRTWWRIARPFAA